jgi:two-component system, cell cycle sensor histidine kinase and response regulator CckA
VGGRGETLLLVEDEAAVRELLAEALRNQGYRVLRAADGEEALEAARRIEGDLHLLVTDVIMPGMSGQMLAQRLAAERPGLRVLFVSGYGDETFGQRGIGRLHGAILEKPFTSKTLTRKVREVLDAPAPGPVPG